MTSNKIIIEARINEYSLKAVNPNIPYSVDEIVRAAVDVRAAGAAILHYHARGLDGSADTSVEMNAEIIRRVRAETDLLVLPTLGFISNDSAAERRIDTVAMLAKDPATRPDIAPIDTGTANLDEWDQSSTTFQQSDRIYVNSTTSLIHYAKTLREVGVKPKMVSWSVGFTRRAMALMDAGYIDEPGYLLFHLTGGKYLTGHPPTVEGLMAHLAFIPKDKGIHWTVNCLGGNLLPLVPVIAQLGGNFAIGIGDYPYPELGLPDNGALVREAVHMARIAGRTPATPAEVREMLRL